MGGHVSSRCYRTAPAKPDPYERGRMIALRVLGKSPATLKGDRRFEKGRAISKAVLAELKANDCDAFSRGRRIAETVLRQGHRAA
jgi:hypothetical protein